MCDGAEIPYVQAAHWSEARIPSPEKTTPAVMLRSWVLARLMWGHGKGWWKSFWAAEAPNAPRTFYFGTIAVGLTPSVLALLQSGLDGLEQTAVLQWALQAEESDMVGYSRLLLATASFCWLPAPSKMWEMDPCSFKCREELAHMRLLHGCLWREQHFRSRCLTVSMFGVGVADVSGMLLAPRDCPCQCSAV